MNTVDNKAREFEVIVADLLREMGWHTEADVVLASHQLDLYAERRFGVVPIRLAVECKAYDKQVGNSEVHEFASRAALLRSHGLIDKAMIVSKQGFTASAKDAAEKYGISCASYEELLASLVDFSPYLKMIISDYERSAISRHFVEPLLKTEDGDAVPALHYLEHWLEDQSRWHLSLLGDAGSGKTALCQRFAYQMAKDQLSRVGRTRVPVLVSLKDYQHSTDLRQFITDLLVNEYGVRIGSYSYFERLLREGRILLMFDGLDEVSPRSSSDAAWPAFWEIADLAKPGSKVLLTCRTQYFRSQVQQETLLKGSSDGISSILSERPRFAAVYLEPWTNKQINEYIEKTLPGQAGEVLRTVNSTYNLLELSRRPVLLAMITRTIPYLGQAGTNRAALYRAYIDASLDREAMSRRHGWFDRDRMRAFLQHLAMRMFEKNLVSMPAVDLQGEVDSFFRNEEGCDTSVLLSSVFTLPFFSRDEGGRYMFSHRSFMEYFIAEKLASQEELGESAVNYPAEIQEFLKGILVRRLEGNG